MTRQMMDIILYLSKHPFENQRIVAEAVGCSIGLVSQSLRFLKSNGYISDINCLTEKTWQILNRCRPRNAIILAAGYGTRMVPINMNTNKAFLEINGQPLIERMIQQLKEVQIEEIYVVVGFIKEQFEYLIEKYGVKLIVNTEYREKNNLHSLALTANRIGNTYIVPCDIWSGTNPFSTYELYSWYLLSETKDPYSLVKMNRKGELAQIHRQASGNHMLGIAYIVNRESERLRRNLAALDKDIRNADCFWEKALIENDKYMVQARVAGAAESVEINTYEQLRELDDRSINLKSTLIDLIARELNVSHQEISDFTVLKKGMTNRSFIFKCNGESYIMRIPGEGTDQLINRYEEANVYRVLDGKDITDEIVYFDPENGYKITKFLKNSRVCNSCSVQDVAACMQRLKYFHDESLRVEHEFDIFEKINYYESLWEGDSSVFRDYDKTKRRVFSLQTIIENSPRKKVLTHIDAVPDNFLFVFDEKGEETIRLIDWEYAAMQDPHVDIAMFCIYALYDRIQIDQTIDLYFHGLCDEVTRRKIYCYIAACGLLWSNWCEYKRKSGVEFGEYSLRQYGYAKEYYKIVMEKWGNEFCLE